MRQRLLQLEMAIVAILMVANLIMSIAYWLGLM